jgi:gamma-glutamyl hercynylcysteine S-oxide hydrolase
MCRWIAYLGPDVTLEELLVAPPHSLVQQAKAPRQQTFGIDNPDGFGVGWYDLERRPEPARHRTTKPIWDDASFASFAGVVSSGSIVAAVRAASPGLPIEETSSQPFTYGPWLFVHNGTVTGFCDGAGDTLRSMISNEHRGVIEGQADSEVLFALVLDRIAAGDEPAPALASAIRKTDEVCGGRMNLALTNGRTIAATAYGNSLYTLERSGAVVVASEPFDDGRDWQRLPDSSLVTAERGRVEVKPL